MENIHRLVIPYKDIFTTVYVIKTPIGAMLFDTATTDEDAKGYIIPFLEKLGITPDNLKYIFISHNHRDHAGSLRYLMKNYPESIALSNSPDIMKNLGEDRVIMPKDDDVFLDFLKPVSIPGHTLDSCAVLDMRTNTLVSGDCLQVYGICGSGLWGANIRFPGEYFEALSKLHTLDIEEIYAAHNYYPCDYKAIGKGEVKRFIELCREPLEKVMEIMDQNPLEDDEEIAQKYNKSDLPTLGSHVVSALREMGNPSYSPRKLKQDLLGMGISKGDVVLMHSSYASMGKLQGGAETFFKVLLDVLGKEGTLVLPSLTFDSVNEDNPVFDKDSTPGCVGYLSEYFRTKVPGVIRSMHATHSCCAWGRYAREITRNHAEDITPGGKNSPFTLLPRYNGKILMLGCGLRCNTSMHAVEETAEPPYCIDRTKTVKYVLKSQDKTITQDAYRHNFAKDNGQRYVQRYDRIEELLDFGKIKHGYVLNAESYLIDACAMWEKAHEKLLKEPMYFVD